MTGGDDPEIGNDLDDLRDQLRALGRRPVPEPSAGFADRLEHRLRALHLAGGRSVGGSSRRRGPQRGRSPRGPRVDDRSPSNRLGRQRGRRRWPTTLVAAAFSAAAVMLGVGSLRGSSPEVRVSAAHETVVVMPGGAVVEARPGLVVPEGAVLEVGPTGSVRFGDMSLGPGQTAVVDDGGLRIGRSGEVAALLEGTGGEVVSSDVAHGGPVPTRRPLADPEAATVSTTVPVEPTAVTTEVEVVPTSIVAEPSDPDTVTSTPGSDTVTGEEPGSREPEGDIGTASSQVREPDPTTPGDPPEVSERTEPATTTTTTTTPGRPVTPDPPDDGPGLPEAADPEPTGDSRPDGGVAGEGNSGQQESYPSPCPTEGGDPPPDTTAEGLPVGTTQVPTTVPETTSTPSGSPSTTSVGSSDSATSGGSTGATGSVGSTTTVTTSDPSLTSLPGQLLLSVTTEGTGDCLPPEVESVIQTVEDILTAIP